jgi:hypothetical protein
MPALSATTPSGPRPRLSQLRPLHPAAAAFLLAFAGFLIALLLQGQKTFYYDAAEYWRLSETFTSDGHFSLLNFENTGIRGYALPLVYHLVRGIAEPFTSDPQLIAIVFNAALCALLGSVLTPKLARIAWPESTWSVPRRLAICALILIFWRGYLSYPLSDFAALTAAMLALIAISVPTSPLAMLGAGLAAGLALNMRPAYILLVPLLLALVIWAWHRQRQQGGDRAAPWRRPLGIALFLLGATVVCVPQSLSQHDTFGGYSPIPGGSKLSSFQYTVGLELQSYGGYIGNDLMSPHMEYVDPHTESILAELPGETVSGSGEYAELILRHPLTMGGVFLRHVVNGLDQRYVTPYTEHLDYPGQRLLRFGGFLLAFLALLRVAWPRARRGLGVARWRYPAVLLLISASSLPSAMENRFLLPVFLLSCMLVTAPGWPSPRGPRGAGLARYRTLAVILLCAACFFALAAAIVSGASENLRLS